MSVIAVDTQLLPVSSVCLFVCWSGKCIVTKRLIGSNAVWGGEWGRSRDEVVGLGGDRRRGRSSFGGEFGTSHCNQWGLCCVVVQNCVNQSSSLWGGEWSFWRDECIRWVHMP